MEGGAYSKAIKGIKLARKGCDDVPGSGLTETRCGCGQLEDACLDCNSSPNGGNMEIKTGYMIFTVTKYELTLSLIQQFCSGRL